MSARNNDDRNKNGYFAVFNPAAIQHPEEVKEKMGKLILFLVIQMFRGRHCQRARASSCRPAKYLTCVTASSIVSCSTFFFAWTNESADSTLFRAFYKKKKELQNVTYVL